MPNHTNVLRIAGWSDRFMSCCIRARGIELRNHVASESPDSTANALAGPLRSYQRRRLRYVIGSSKNRSRRTWTNLTDAESAGRRRAVRVGLTLVDVVPVERPTARRESPQVLRAG